MPETLHHINDSICFPENFITFTKILSEIIQNLTIDHNNIEIKITTRKINYSLLKTHQKTLIRFEASPTDTIDTKVRSRPLDTNLNKTTETDFSFTLLDDGELSSLHTKKHSH